MREDPRPSRGPDERPPTARQHWWLVGPPVLLLFANAGVTLGRLGDPTISVSQGQAIVELTLAGLALVAALALLARRRIGWLLALSIVGWDLAASLSLWWLGTPDFVSLGLLTVAAWLITSPDVRDLYAGRSTP